MIEFFTMSILFVTNTNPCTNFQSIKRLIFLTLNVSKMDNIIFVLTVQKMKIDSPYSCGKYSTRLGLCTLFMILTRMCTLDGQNIAFSTFSAQFKCSTIRLDFNQIEQIRNNIFIFTIASLFRNWERNISIIFIRGRRLHYKTWLESH